MCPIQLVALFYIDTGAEGCYIELFIASAPLDCAIWVLWINNVVKFSLPDNTINWKVWVPELYKQYPDKAMVNNYAATVLPSVNLADNDAKGKVNLNMSSLVVMPDKSVKRVFTLGIDMTVDLNAWVAHGKPPNATHWHLYVNVTKVNIDLKVVQSDIGPIDLLALKGFIAIITPTLVKLIDQALENGFPLPIGHGVSLINPVVRIHNGYAEVNADFGFQPSVLKNPESLFTEEITTAQLELEAPVDAE